MDKPPRVVAELGRPETPDETAARKAAASLRHRQNQTTRNLVLALAACLGIVLLVVLVVVRPAQPAAVPVDWSAAAREQQPSVDARLADPALPPQWTANSARVDVRSGVTSWYIGFITPAPAFIGMRQGIDADASWLSDELEKSQQTGTVDIDGTTWAVYDRRDVQNPGNLEYSIGTQSGRSTYVLFGTASDAEFRTLASAVVAEFDPAPSS